MPSHKPAFSPHPSEHQAGDRVLEVGRRPLPRVGLRGPEAYMEGSALSGESCAQAWSGRSRVLSLQRGEERRHTLMLPKRLELGTHEC